MSGGSFVMAKINENLKNIESENSFAKVIKLANAYKIKHPDNKVIISSLSLFKYILISGY